MKSLYKTEAGKQEVLNLYENKLVGLNVEHTSEYIETSFGKTHCLIVGKKENPPLIIVHGSNACAPIALATFPNLSRKFRVIAVDVLAQPNKSSENRMNMKNNSYGEWLNEVMVKMELTNVTLVSFSFGGLIVLKTLLANAERVKEVFLVGSAFIANGNPFRLFLNVFLPIRLYLKSKNTVHIERIVTALFNEDEDGFAVSFLSKVFLWFDMDFSPIPVITKAEANTITTPITLFAGENDIVFPGEKVITRAKKIFSTLKYVELFEESKHVLSRAENNKVEALVLTSIGE